MKDTFSNYERRCAEGRKLRKALFKAASVWAERVSTRNYALHPTLRQEDQGVRAPRGKVQAGAAVLHPAPLLPDAHGDHQAGLFHARRKLLLQVLHRQGTSDPCVMMSPMRGPSVTKSIIKSAAGCGLSQDAF